MYIQFTTADGGTVLVEAADEQGELAGVVKAATRGERGAVVAQAKEKFEAGLAVVRQNADAFLQQVRGLSEAPSEVEITFGIKASGELGNFAVARAGAEASYTVKLTWKRETKS